jgi:hypothetical protein
MQISPAFKSAYNDYLDLLTKKYPQKTILKLIGDRYKLSGTERSLLFRGVAPEIISLNRKKKTTNIIALQNSSLHIDGLNQIWTIATYLSGGLVFIALDGLLRDVSEIHGNTMKLNLVDKSIKILIKCLKNIGNCSFEIYIDEQVNHAQEIISKIISISEKEKLPLKLYTSKVVDYKLKNITSGFLATSDSEIIDKSKVPIIDFARNCLEKEFNPYFFNLDSIRN